MKCYEIRKCSEKEREACYVWNSFRETPDDMDNIKCWVLKNVYQQENRDLLKQCLTCKYYAMINKEGAVVSDYDADLALVSCEGVLNNEKSRALGEVWQRLKTNGKVNVVLNLSNVNNIYSCGLGVLVKIHKETMEAGGKLVITGAGGYVMATFESTRLTRLLTLVSTDQEAREVFAELAKKKVGEPAQSGGEAPAPPKERPSCWDYWNNHNPSNATACDECFRKQNPTGKPCWIVEGMIEGVSFEYVNEECESCEYYLEFGKGPEET